MGEGIVVFEAHDGLLDFPYHTILILPLKTTRQEPKFVPNLNGATSSGGFKRSNSFMGMLVWLPSSYLPDISQLD